ALIFFLILLPPPRSTLFPYTTLFRSHCKTIPREKLHLPGPDFIDRVYAQTDRPTSVLRSLAEIFSHGRLGGTGYLSILPVDQGRSEEHTSELQSRSDLVCRLLLEKKK